MNNNANIFNNLLLNINNLHNYCNDNNLIELFSKFNVLENENNELKNKISNLELEIITKDSIIMQMKEEAESFKKTSLIHSLNKQLAEHIKHINTLENQLKKKDIKNIINTDYLNKNNSEKKNILDIKNEKEKEIKLDTKDEKDKEIKLDTKDDKEIKKEKEIKLDTKNNEDNEEYEEFDGYELIMYKKKYYYSNNNTNELYNIVNGHPKKCVGIIQTSGKVKLY